MKYITVLITDTHFGTHNNSLTWLKSQLSFFNNQFIPHIKELKEKGYSVRLVHCGDVFDSRSTINSYIANTVVKLFDELCGLVDKMIIVNGNHDFYQPSDDSVDTVNLLFKQLQLTHDNKLYIISDKKWEDVWGNETDLCVPWYEWIKQDDLIEYLENTQSTITHIFTHADLVRDGAANIDCNSIISGHIHTPYFKDNIKNLGSCFSLTFADCNSERGFYEYEEGGDLKFIVNEYSIRFWRLYDKEILKIPSYIKADDYIELYISKSKIAQKKYVDAYADWVKTFKNIWRVPQLDDDENVSDIKKFEGYNIETMTEELIPEELKDKFEQIKQYINSIKD